MRRLIIFCTFILIGFVVAGQSQQKQTSLPGKRLPADKEISDALKSKTDSQKVEVKTSLRKKLIQSKDTLVMSDYMMSIDRVNDNLNSVSDSSRMGFEVVRMSRRIDGITDDISIIRKSIRGRSSSFNIKNLYLYQSFASALNDENDRIEDRTSILYHRVNKAKLRLKTVLSDSVLRALYTDPRLRSTFKRNLARLERKWDRTDSITKENVDTLNAMKVKIADNAVNLSDMLNMMDMRLDRAGKQLFGQEVNSLWQKGPDKYPGSRQLQSYSYQDRQ